MAGGGAGVGTIPCSELFIAPTEGPCDAPVLPIVVPIMLPASRPVAGLLDEPAVATKLALQVEALHVELVAEIIVGPFDVGDD